MNKKLLKTLFPAFLAILAIVLISIIPLNKKDIPHISFITEIYDIIYNNYWEKIEEKDLINRFQSAIPDNKNVEIKNKEELENYLTKILQNKEDKEEFVVNLANSVLLSLKPLKRSALYTQKQEQSLEKTVYNRTSEDTFYSALKVKKDDSKKKIEEAFEKSEKTEKQKQAFDILSNQKTKNIYDQTGEANPTIETKILNGNIAYIRIKRISPQSYAELMAHSKILDKKGDENTNSLIIDLRNNIGGSIDILPYFLGPFIGLNQYAYEFYSQGEKTPFKTKTGWLNSLVKYKKVIILINEKMQSSAEVIASVLKKYNVGILVGKNTKGWGTIERVFPIENQISEENNYSVFLVHSITLREDGQPIEGRGINPDISINNKKWPEMLYDYIPDQILINEVKRLFN